MQQEAPVQWQWRGLKDPYTLLFLALVAGFVLFKLPFLGLPYFWDEAWVYAPAVQALYQHGPSLLPDALPPELSRGHPLLFHFACSLWMEVFGTTPSSVHAFALAVSVGLLVLVYVTGRQLASAQVGLAAALLLTANELFLAQSAILLPEVMLAVFVLWAAAAYVRRKPFLYVLAATSALLVKESAIVLVLALLGWHLLHWALNRDNTEVRRARWSFVLLAPLALAGLFFLLQRIQQGWFFFPEHIGYTSWDVRDIGYKLKLGFTLLFERQGQFLLSCSFAFVIPLAWRGRDRRWGLLAVGLYVAAIKVLFGKWALPGVWTLLVPLACLICVFFLLFVPFQRQAPRRGELTAVGFPLVLGLLLFTALNFFSDRYLLAAVPFIVLGSMIFLQEALSTYPRWIFPTLVLVMAGWQIAQIGTTTDIGDTRLNYADAVRMDQQLVRFCAEERLQDAVFHASFLERTDMTEPSAGYLGDHPPFRRVRPEMGDDVQYLVITCTSEPAVVALRNAPGWELWKAFRSGVAWGELYRRAPGPSA